MDEENINCTGRERVTFAAIFGCSALSREGCYAAKNKNEQIREQRSAEPISYVCSQPAPKNRFSYGPAWCVRESRFSCCDRCRFVRFASAPAIFALDNFSGLTVEMGMFKTSVIGCL